MTLTVKPNDCLYPARVAINIDGGDRDLQCPRIGGGAHVAFFAHHVRGRSPFAERCCLFLLLLLLLSAAVGAPSEQREASPSRNTSPLASQEPVPRVSCLADGVISSMLRVPNTFDFAYEKTCFDQICKMEFSSACRCCWRITAAAAKKKLA